MSEDNRFKAVLQQTAQWFKSRLMAMNLRTLLLMLVGGVAIFALCCTVCYSGRYNLEEGDIAPRDIVATRDVEDRLTTSENRARAEAAVGPSYHADERINQEVLNKLEDAFIELDRVQDYGVQLTANNQGVGALLTVFTTDAVAYARSQLTVVTLEDAQIKMVMQLDDEGFEQLRQNVTGMVATALESSISEGGEQTTINIILSKLSQQTETSLSGNLIAAIRSVLTQTLRANMVLDEERMAADRQRARNDVQPTLYRQGQTIIEKGEKASKYQIAVLKELEEFSINVYLGALLLVTLALSVLWLLLKILIPEVLNDLRSLTIILIVILLCQGLSAFCISLINVYLSPVALCAILLTGLFGSRVGFASGLSMTVLVAALSAGSSNTYSSEMVNMILTGIAGNVVAVRFLAKRQQRVSVVICGALVALTNFLVMLAIGLMTAVNLDATLSNAVWYLASGLLSGMVALALQPVFESAFNLATPSKLMELANPNHPLLRRLLMEAPGTYHHSIIVANLAEAAAEQIGANMLLTRTGAYFHDVGKLKRPMYFKENQRGDNPHDRTDAYVSAAIVTAHTRDGLQLAQKYRLPAEIQRIILEHHGDTPVMYFYHKALQQADGKPVDVKDFRYGGSRPATRESAIVMLADTIEAAVRSMAEPTPQAIQRFIERLVRGKIEDGQLSNSPLTLRDIDGICEAFIKVLRGVFHERIEYPTVHIDRTEEAASEPEKPATPAPAEEERVKAEAESAAEASVNNSDSMPLPYNAPMPDGLLPEDAEALSASSGEENA